MAVKVLSGLINILKKTDPKIPDSMIVNRVCEFVDKIHNCRGNGSSWSLSTWEKDGQTLIFFLGELSRVGLISQVDKIFIYGKGHFQLVIMLSTCKEEDKFFEMFHKLQKEYQINY